MKRIILLAALGLVALPVNEASADLTAQGSAGIQYIVGGDAVRSPITFELGPGFQIAIVRFEIPVVFAAAGNSAFPPQSGVFLGLRPTVKVFPFDPFYAKASTQIFFADKTHIGLGLGGGVEYMVADLIGVFGEVTVNPYLEADTGMPVELRIGATAKF